MKKFGFMLMVLLVGAFFAVQPAEAAYLSEHDKYVEVSYGEARQLADLLGLKDIPLGEETAKLSFQYQEQLIATIEERLNIEIDHYYIWLTVDGEPVLGIDPPYALY
ncbi:8-amino-7-oxononanoate synthase [Bacillus sp. V3-13]|uniref:8-amino-7-oxononanoate synthase n=1 Tax=Bacillus sp. V3-13 TaxID=2053728 RepID=UPI000C7747F3|nr:8-amino-7-oxononanoate synthase [Bacillus sp. V3-13]PLR78458.1 8-amino-7-oxononanoate synthase [Bacillus sp. V3-13]